jgi:hypothetical protein
MLRGMLYATPASMAFLKKKQQGVELRVSGVIRCGKGCTSVPSTLMLDSVGIHRYLQTPLT